MAAEERERPMWQEGDQADTALSACQAEDTVFAVSLRGARHYVSPSH